MSAFFIYSYMRQRRLRRLRDMDDSVSDDINVVTSDDDAVAGEDSDSVREFIDLEDDEYVMDSDDGGGDEARVEVLSDGGAVTLTDSDSGGGRESPESDEVVIVDDNVNVLVQESEYDQSSAGEDERGEEEERAADTPPPPPPPPLSTATVPATPPQHRSLVDARLLRVSPPRAGPAHSSRQQPAVGVEPSTSGDTTDLRTLAASGGNNVPGPSTSRLSPGEGSSVSSDDTVQGPSTSRLSPREGSSVSSDDTVPGPSTSRLSGMPPSEGSLAVGSGLNVLPGSSRLPPGEGSLAVSSDVAVPGPSRLLPGMPEEETSAVSSDVGVPGTSRLFVPGMQPGEGRLAVGSDVTVPGPFSSVAIHVAGTPSSSQGQNTSMDDFQIPLSRRPAVLDLAAAAAGSDESMVEFRSPKRRRLVSPIKSLGKGDGDRKSGVGGEEEEDDGNCCSICFEPWDNSGRHRLSSLKCGHLFGLGCIEKWLKGQGGKCPSCNEKAKTKDIRIIYAKAIKMVDTTERDRALHELEREKELRRHAELEAAQVRLQCQQCSAESGRLRDEVHRLRSQLTSVRSHSGGEGATASQSSQPHTSSHSQHLQGRFVHDRTVKIWEGGQCRVLAHCPSLAALVISQPSNNRLFPGYGVKKLSCLDYKTSSFMILHQKALRGVSFHPLVDDGILLSVSMDRTVKLTSMQTNNVVQTYTTPLPLWSCEWNADDQNYFYAGQQNGRVLEFDTRVTTGHVREVNEEGSKSPAVALQYMSRDIHAAFKPGGLIVGQLDRVSFFESKGDNHQRLHILPLEGNLTSLNVDPETRHLLASFRPTAKHPTVRHQLCELTCSPGVGDTVVSCNAVHTFHGGRSQSVLGRTGLLTHPLDPSRLLVVAGDEQSEAAHLWDTGTSQLTQRLSCQGVPLDFTSFTHGNQTFLAALTDKTLKLHRWN